MQVKWTQVCVCVNVVVAVRLSRLWPRDTYCVTFTVTYIEHVSLNCSLHCVGELSHPWTD